MRKKMMKSSKVDLPQEILEQIFVKLPMKSIARFRCLSKPCSKLLTDLKFLENNFELLKKQSNINFKTMVCNGDDLYSLEFERGGNLRVIKMDHSFRITEDSTRIMGSCKGLICLVERSWGDVYLWNPNTLPIKHKADDFYPNEPDEPCDWSWLLYGFGYNATKRDFRLVRIYSTDEARYQSHVHVYALRRNLWRDIDYFRMPYIVITHGQFGGALINDNLHWPACRVTDLKLDAHLIIAYDIHNGKGFKEVELPDFECKHWFIRSVGVLNGFLTVCFGDLKDKTKFEARIMLNYGLKESWRNLFKITTSETLDDLVPLYFMNNGTEILLSNISDFYLYDSKDQDEPLKKYEVPNLPRGTYQSIAYLDSDISPC